MKTIYESILSSTRSGKDEIVSGLKDFIIKDFDHSTNNMFGLNRVDKINIEPKNGLFAIDIKTDYKGDYIRFDKWFDDTLNFVHQIESVCINKKPVNVTYCGIDFVKNEKFVSVVKDTLTIRGGNILLLNSLPKNCKTINFDYMNDLGGGSPVRVKEIRDITVNDFVVSQRANGTSTLSCNIDRIKNITVLNKMYITDGMLGYASLEKGARTFEKETSDMLDRFFKNNNVDPAKVVFLPNPKQSKKQMSLYYNKNKQRWCTNWYVL